MARTWVTAMMGMAGLALLTACGGPMRSQPTVGGCPSAAQVGFAQWATPRPPEGERDDSEATWMVRLGYRWKEPGEPEPGPLHAYEVAKLGLGPLPPLVWLLRAGAAPCQGSITGYVAELVDDGPESIMISAVLTGCPAGDEAYARGWVSLASSEPAGCEVRLPEPAGARREEETDAGFWVAPETEATRLPARWQDATPEGACEAPCETLWSIATVAGEPALHSVLISELEPGPDHCDIYSRNAFGLYATTADGGTHLLRGPAGDNRYWTPLMTTTLAGALHDAGGNRAVLAVGVDDWSAYDVGVDGKVGAGRHVQFFVAPEEDGLHLSLAPYCGP